MNLVITPLRVEAGVLLTHLREVRSVSISGGAAAWKGRDRRGCRVAVGCTGPGVRRARQRGRSLIDVLAPDRVTVWGTAGALAPELKAGDLAVSRAFVDGEDGEVISAHRTPPLPSSLPKDARRVRSLTWSWPVFRFSTRRRLALRYDCGVVQMEDAALARLGRRRDVPFVAFRSVLDGFSYPPLPDPARFRYLWRAFRLGARCAVECAAPE